MKKYLLTALLGVFGLFGFVSAVELDLTKSGNSYNPSSYILESDITFTTNSFSNVSCMNYDRISINDDDYNTCEFSYNNGSFSLSDVNHDCTFTAGTTIYFSNGARQPCESLTLYVGGSSSSGGGDSDNSPLLSGGTTVFSGIISSLGSAVSEFIPYVAYIGIGLLSAIIGFVAIKRLINRIRAKIFGTFNSRRRK